MNISMFMDMDGKFHIHGKPNNARLLTIGRDHACNSYCTGLLGVAYTYTLCYR